MSYYTTNVCFQEFSNNVGTWKMLLKSNENYYVHVVDSWYTGLGLGLGTCIMYMLLIHGIQG